MPINSQIFTAPDGLPSILDNSLNGLPQDIRRIIPTPEAVFVEPLQYNDLNTIVLLHGDGSDGSATITDSALGGAHTWARSNQAQIDTAQKKFGTGSILFDGSGDKVNSSTFNLADLGAGDWTIDCWVKINSWATSHGCIFGEYTNNQNLLYWYLGTSGTSVFAHATGNVFNIGGISLGAGSLSLGIWYHLAIVRWGGTYSQYLNGELKTRVVDYDNITTSPSGGHNVGHFTNNGSSNFWQNGWIEEYRVSNVARWTKSFTPQTIQYGTAPS